MFATDTNELDEITTTGELVRSAQAGDRDAFGALVERYQSSAYAIALRRLRNHAEAEELVQEVFVQALRKIDQLREGACFGSWLRAITVRMAINRAVRAAPVYATEPETFVSVCVNHETPLTSALTEERRLRVQAGLGRLRRLDRETLEAFYVRGQSLAEMSNEFSSPVGTIKRRLHVARKRLAKELEDMAEPVGA